MTDARPDPAPDAIQPTPADAVTDAAMVPMDDAAGGPTADKDDAEGDVAAGTPDEGEIAAQLGDFA